MRLNNETEPFNETEPLMRLNICRWDKRSRAFVVDNLFSIECAELDDLVAVLEVRWRQRDK